ncbi:MAG: YncE family protein [Mycobacterium sp.]|uniref:YncE family protein n=1 Tax=Mycobacterium sp. TaxID=1785 RepID=UPI001EC57B41|nr:YncE family protein [Mycobacterium sp.]MBW0018843.1 YncE family protein [Mycobacterium sp.]
MSLETDVPDALVEIPVHRGPISGIVVSADGSRLLVTNYGDDSVAVIDTETCRVLEVVAQVTEPFAIAMGPDRAYVSTVSNAYDSIEVIDAATNTVVATHPLALSVSDLTVSSDGKYVYAGQNGVWRADIAVLDTTTNRIDVIDVAETAGTTIECVRLSPDGGRLYVGTNGPAGGRLLVIATGAQADDGRSSWRRKKSSTRSGARRILGTVDIGSAIRDVAISHDGVMAYVASCGPDFGAVVDFVDTRTTKITGTRKIAEIGGLVTQLALSGDGDRAYLVSEDRVTALCTLTQDVVGIMRATQPSCVVESPDGAHLYIADYAGSITLTPVISAGQSELDDPAEWTMPELLQYEPALA